MVFHDEELHNHFLKQTEKLNQDRAKLFRSTSKRGVRIGVSLGIFAIATYWYSLYQVSRTRNLSPELDQSD